MSNRTNATRENYTLSEIRLAAPEYAEVPTVSSTSAKAANSAGPISPLHKCQIIAAKTRTHKMDLQVVLTRFDGTETKSCLEEVDMSILMSLDLLKASSDPRRESCVSERRLGVGVKILGVKSSLEIFESQSEVQDLSIWGVI